MHAVDRQCQRRFSFASGGTYSHSRLHVRIALRPGHLVSGCHWFTAIAASAYKRRYERSRYRFGVIRARRPQAFGLRRSSRRSTAVFVYRLDPNTPALPLRRQRDLRHAFGAGGSMASRGPSITRTRRLSPSRAWPAPWAWRPST